MADICIEKDLWNEISRNNLAYGPNFSTKVGNCSGGDACWEKSTMRPSHPVITRRACLEKRGQLACQ